MTIPSPERPMMKNYGIEKGKEGQMTWAWVDAQMKKSRNYWICTTRADGRPHAMPVWGAWVDGTLYFGTDTESVKARNMRRSPEVVVHLESGDDAVIMEGTVEVITTLDETLFKRIGDAYEEKYPEYRPDKAEGLYRVKARKVFAWLESSFPKTATRWMFE